MSLLLVAGGVGALVTPTAADEKTVKDPKGDFSPLDIRKVVHAHGSEPERVRHVLASYNRWKGRKLKGSGLRIEFFFDTDGSRKHERSVFIRWRSGKLHARFFGRTHDEPLDHPVRVWRTTRRNVKIAFNLDALMDEGLLPKDLERYRWYAEVYWSGICPVEDPGPKPCSDRAPNKGWIVHDLST